MRRRLAIAIGASALLVAACSSILGFQDLSPLGPDASSPSDAANDATSSGDAPTPPGDDAQGSDGSGVDANCGADLTGDPKNCGRCGHSCLGGTCGNSVCQPVTMVKALGSATGIAADKNYLYVADQEDAQVIRIAKNVADGSFFVVAAPGPYVSSPVDVDVDDTNVYWVEFLSPYGGVLSCPTTGCIGNPTILAANVDGPNTIKVLGSSVYWAEQIGYEIWRADKTDGGAPKILVHDDAGIAFERIAVDQSFVYFSGKVAVGRVPLGGGAIDFYNQSLWVDAISASPAGLLWGYGSYADPAGFIALSTVQPPDGGVDGDLPYTTLASAQFNPLAIVTDGTRAYWVNGGAQDQATGTIASCPLSGCAGGVTVLARSLEWPTDLVVDDVAVYWTVRGLKGTTGNATVMKVAKP